MYGYKLGWTPRKVNRIHLRLAKIRNKRFYEKSDSTTFRDFGIPIGTPFALSYTYVLGDLKAIGAYMRGFSRTSFDFMVLHARARYGSEFAHVECPARRRAKPSAVVGTAEAYLWKTDVVALKLAFARADDALAGNAYVWVSTVNYFGGTDLIQLSLQNKCQNVVEVDGVD
jgi:hypothetical protein